MQQVQQIMGEVNMFELAQRARPGDVVVGKWDDQGFHPTGLAGSYELPSSVPPEWMTRAVEQLKLKYPDADTMLRQVNEWVRQSENQPHLERLIDDEMQRCCSTTKGSTGTTLGAPDEK